MHPASPLASAILAVQEQFWRALQTKDAALFTAVLAPEFVGRSPGEPDQTRDEFIARLLNFSVSVSEIAGESLAVHAWGEVAVLTGVQVAQLQMPDGTQQCSRVMLSNVFCHQNEGWKMVLSFAFELVQPL